MNRRDALQTIPLTLAGLTGSVSTSHAAPNGNPSAPYAEVKPYNGTPTLFLSGKPVFYSGLWVATPTPDHWGHKPGSWPLPLEGDTDTAQRTARTGSHIYAFITGSEWCGPRAGRSDHFDFSKTSAQFEQILKTDPDAVFHLRIQMEMSGRNDESSAAAWWNKIYPDECEITSEGKQREQSYASTVWRKEGKEFLQAYIAHVRSIGLVEKVAAWQVCAGQSTEWTKWSSSGSFACGDFSDPMRRHFQAFLRKKYSGDLAVFRKAWGKADISFDTPVVPSAAEQLQSRNYCFRDPKSEQNVIDYYTCLAELCADVIIDFSKTIKEATVGKAMTGASYGYTLTCVYNQGFYGEGPVPVSSDYSHTQRGGHLGLGRILASPYIDFLGSPISYGFRGIGGDSSISQITESCRLHGKLCIMEEDSRILDQPPNPRFGQVKTREDSIAVLKRNFARVVTHGHGVWRAPMGDNSLYPLLEQFNKIGAFALKTDRSPCAEVAVIIDEESFFYESIKYDLDLANLSHQTLQGLARFGAPYDQYLLDDFIEGKLPPYKLYLFLNAFHLDAARREKLARELRRNGRVAVWVYAPGYIKDSNSTDNMKELTGMQFGRGDYPWPAFMHITDFTHPATEGLPQDLFWSFSAALGPMFYLQDPDVRVLGQAALSQGMNVPGMGVKVFPEWTSIYIAVPDIPAPVLRGLAWFSKVHLYSDAGDVLYASKNLLGVHTVSGGQREFRLPVKVPVVYDLFAEKIIGRNTDTFKVTLAPKSTELYYMGDKAIL